MCLAYVIRVYGAHIHDDLLPALSVVFLVGIHVVKCDDGRSCCSPNIAALQIHYVEAGAQV
jgi:hypothetical protein